MRAKTVKSSFGKCDVHGVQITVGYAFSFCYSST